MNLLPDDDGNNTSIGGSFAQSHKVHKVVRHIKKQEVDPFSCIASIIHDASFVGEIRCLYPTLPCLANLRCGLWYQRQFDGTCYFKSTDGHNGAWSFSTTRLNTHVAYAAASRGGAIIVDATRRGKTFPDALTKTVPIWAAVVNRAVAVIRRRRATAAAAAASHTPPTAASGASTSASNPTATAAATGAGGSASSSGGDFGDSRDGQQRHRRGGGGSDSGSNSAGGSADSSGESCGGSGSGGASGQSLGGSSGGGGGGGDGVSWDERLHLPLWISANERSGIQARLDGWVSQLLESGADLLPLADSLRKPLRPLWVSQATTIFVNEVPPPEQLHFTPLILVSASAPPGSCHGMKSVTFDRPDGTQGSWSYAYLPGAGDDEESWALGLTPQLLWRHSQRIMEAGPGRLQDLVPALLRGQGMEQQGQQQQQDGGGAEGNALGSAVGGSDGSGGPDGICRASALGAVSAASPSPLAAAVPQAWDQGACAAAAGRRPLAQAAPLSARVSAAAAAATPAAAAALSSCELGMGPATAAAMPLPQHAMPPLGCRASTGMAAAACATWVLPGRIMVGPLEEVAAPDLWRVMGAVLNVGDRQHASLEGESSCEWEVHTPAAQPSSEVSEATSSIWDQQQHRRIAAVPGACSCSKPMPVARLVGALCRHAWLPGKRGTQRERLTLRQRLPAAAGFVVDQLLRGGGPVLVVCDDGMDSSVCVALAAIMILQAPACQPMGGGSCAGGDGHGGGLAQQQEQQQQQARELPGQQQQQERELPGQQQQKRELSGQQQQQEREMPAQQRSPEGLLEAAGGCREQGSLSPSAQLSKHRVRQQLAVFSSMYPAARPTRVHLKHVFNYLACIEAGCPNAG